MTAGSTVRRGTTSGRLLMIAVAVVAASLSACSPGSGRGAPPATSAAPAPPSTTSGAADEAVAGTWEALSEPGVGGPLHHLAVDPANPDRVLAAGAATGVAVSEDGGGSWRSGLGLRGRHVRSLTWHPTRADEVWAGTEAGPHLSRDGGATWERRAQRGEGPGAWAPTGPVLVDPLDGDLLAFDGPPRHGPASTSATRAWTSSDGGRTWRATAELGTDRPVTAAAHLADGRTVLAGTDGAGVVRSTDGGATWAPAGGGLPHGVVARVVAHPRRADRAWVALPAAGSPGGVYRSDDGGRTWAPPDDGFPRHDGAHDGERSGATALAVAADEPEVLYTSDLGRGRAALYRSDDGGTRWRRLPGPEGAFYRDPAAAGALAVVDGDPARVLAATASTLFASDDGGTTWRDVGAVPEAEGHRGTGLSAVAATAAAFADDGSLAVQGRDGAALLVRRPDGSWHAPLQDWDPGGGGYDVSIEGDAWWALLGQRGTFNGVARSVDGGLTWDVLVGGDLPERGAAVAPAPRSVLALSDRAALVTLAGRLLRTDDGGRSWRQVTSDVDAALVRSADDPEVVVGTGDAGVHRSDDGGRTFRPVVGAPGGAGDVALGTGGRVYATVPDGAEAGVWRFDGSWRRVLAVVGAAAVAVPADATDRVLVAVDGGPPPAGGGGVLASGDGGRTWDVVGATGPTLGPTTVVAVDGSDVVAGTDGRGFHRLSGG